ncbi:MAG TPA: zinc ribbon domain-containing protein [Gallionella sp.]|nr:zinc ribbon domain-containing protein [Gallionella sp.]
MALAPADIEKLSFDELLEHIRLSRVNVDEYADLAAELKNELKKRQPTHDYKCSKCGHEGFETHEVRTAGGFWSALFSVETYKYRAVVCTRCKFTELYQGYTSDAAQVVDFLFGR